MSGAASGNVDTRTQVVPTEASVWPGFRNTACRTRLQSSFAAASVCCTGTLTHSEALHAMDADEHDFMIRALVTQNEALTVELMRAQQLSRAADSRHLTVCAGNSTPPNSQCAIDAGARVNGPSDAPLQVLPYTSQRPPCQLLLQVSRLEVPHAFTPKACAVTPTTHDADRSSELLIVEGPPAAVADGPPRDAVHHLIRLAHRRSVRIGDAMVAVGVRRSDIRIPAE